ncbi:MAG: class I SAM-dependent methyltransferase [Actinomycetota bacterium]|nr:class I SAM-dependent methyltransferase [Actinomycetota bacterium]
MSGAISRHLDIHHEEFPALSDHISSAWYADFFTELPNEFWRRAASPESTVADVEFIEERLGLTPGSRILDVPCGSGRHSLALAARGHRVTGVDISTDAIAHARRTAADAHLDVEFELADMREIPQAGAFDATVCLGNSFGYLDMTGTRKFVAALAGAVRPGGGLVVDFNATAETVLPGYTELLTDGGFTDIERYAGVSVDRRGARTVRRLALAQVAAGVDVVDRGGAVASTVMSPVCMVRGSPELLGTAGEMIPADQAARRDVVLSRHRSSRVEAKRTYPQYLGKLA